MDKDPLDIKRIIVVCTGTKYSEWFVQNMMYMIDRYGIFHIDEFRVIRDEQFETSMNKIQMFNLFRSGWNLYFDLDVVIRDYLDESIFRKNFTVLNSLWRPRFNAPINSSVMSWYGDMSYIYETYIQKKEYHQLKYGPNDDIFLAENFSYELYPSDLCYSYKWDVGHTDNPNYKICLFNQCKDIMEQNNGWWNKYTLPKLI